MYNQKQLPIWRDTNRLLLEIEQSVRHFPRYHKYTLGSELRLQTMKVARLINRAIKDKEHTLYYLDRLVLSLDDLKIQLQLAKECQAFRNFAEFQRLAELAYNIGKQSGGWRKYLRKRQSETGHNVPRAY
ncbi:MAG: four helix bundle protein [Thiomargarita sp.]|nr:four helix bundle protein [Thiomargarita sp.]